MAARSVIVVDDDAALRKVLGAELARAGYDVRTAADGKEALRLFRERAADLVVTDLFMPVKDGIEVIREVARLDSGVRILAMTGVASGVDYLKAGRELGAWHTIRKPFRASAFLDAVRTCFRLDRPPFGPAGSR